MSQQETGFADAFDQALAEAGPPALFTHSPDGELKLDLIKTRDAWDRLAHPPERDPAHCLLRDEATGYVQYVLATSRALVAEHPRASVVTFDSAGAALEALAELGSPPVVRGPFGNQPR